MSPCSRRKEPHRTQIRRGRETQPRAPLEGRRALRRAKGQALDRRHTYRAASTTCCPAWRRRSSTSAAGATSSCTSTRSSRPTARRPRRGRGECAASPELIQPGQEIVVEVVKDPLKTKGARLSTQLSIAGLTSTTCPGRRSASPFACPTRSASGWPRLIDKVEPRRGWSTVRTPAQREAATSSAMTYLHRLNEVVETGAEERRGRRDDLRGGRSLDRVVRDVLVEESEAAVIDDTEQHDRYYASSSSELAPTRRLRLALRPARGEVQCSRSGTSSGVRLRLSPPRRPALGGYLMIDYAEALTVIDINTVVHRARQGPLEDTITEVNVEAAEEVVRQLRMRDIGGIIVIDFIDMARAKNRDQAPKTWRTALDQDPTKTYVVEVSPARARRDDARERHRRQRRDPRRSRAPCARERVVSSRRRHVAITVVRNLSDLVEDDARRREGRGLRRA